MTDSEPLLVTRESGVLTLQLDRPHARNAISRVLRRRLRDVLQEAAVDPEVRVVVIRGDERAFCSGGDIKEMGNGLADSSAKLALAKQIVQCIADMPQPVVAVVRGHAAGAGFSMALACDLVVADRTATFTAPFTALGLVPDMGGTYWLLRQVGLHRAKDILLTGRPVSAQEAVDLGFVSRLWDADELEDRLDDLTSGLRELSPTALGLTKRLVNRAFETDLGAALDAEQTAQALASDLSDRLNVKDGRTAAD